MQSDYTNFLSDVNSLNIPTIIHSMRDDRSLIPIFIQYVQSNDSWAKTNEASLARVYTELSIDPIRNIEKPVLNAECKKIINLIEDKNWDLFETFLFQSRDPAYDSAFKYIFSQKSDLLRENMTDDELVTFIKDTLTYHRYELATQLLTSLSPQMPAKYQEILGKEMGKALFSAVLANNEKAITTLLKACTKELAPHFFNQRNAANDNVLEHCIRLDKNATVKSLIQNCPTESLETLLNTGCPLHLAIDRKSTGGIQLLYDAIPQEKHALLFSENKQGQTPLGIAVKKDFLKEFLTQTPSDTLPSALECDQKYSTTLHKLAVTGDINGIKILLNQIPTPNLKHILRNDLEGHTALHAALVANQDAAVKALLTHSDQVTSSMLDCDDQGDTPLHVAAAMGKTEMIDLICQHGNVLINDLYEEDQADLHPVHYAILSDNPAALEKALQYYPKETNENLFADNRLLYFAVENNKLQTFNTLISKWPEETKHLIDEPLATGQTLLHFAAFHDNPELIQAIFVLSKAPYMLYQPSNDGKNPIHIAAKAGNAATLSSLIAFVPPTAQSLLFHTDRAGYTPFYYAIADKPPEVMQAIVNVLEQMPASLQLQMTEAYLQANKTDAVDFALMTWFEEEYQAEYLGLAMNSELLSTYLISGHPDIAVEGLAILGSYDQANITQQRLALPLWPPTQIRQVVASYDEHQKLAVLGEIVNVPEGTILNSDGIPRSVEPAERLALEAALSTIAEERIPHLRWNTGSNLAQNELKAFLRTIQINDLAIAASYVPLQSHMVTYLPLLADAQLAVVVPQLSHNIFNKWLKSQAPNFHNVYLAFATTAQRQAYLKSFPPATIILPEWESTKADLLEKRAKYHQELDSEKKNLLAAEIHETLNKLNNKPLFLLKEYPLMTLKTAMTRQEDSPELQEELQSYVTQIVTRFQSLQSQKKELNELLADVALPRDDGPPEVFLDQITQLVMQDPVILPGMGRDEEGKDKIVYVDRSSLREVSGDEIKNPFNNQWYPKEEYKTDQVLKDRIGASNHVV